MTAMLAHAAALVTVHLPAAVPGLSIDRAAGVSPGPTVPAAGQVEPGTTRIPDADTVSPGFAGFLTMFLLTVAVIILIRSMVKHLRKVRYSPDPAAPGSAAGSLAGQGAGAPAPGGAEPGAGAAGSRRAPEPNGRSGG